MSLRTALKRVLANQDEVAATEERIHSAKQGTTAISDLVERRHAEVSGLIRSVVLRPTDRVQAVEAELFDGSGSVDLVWLGRRRIAGIEPGRRVRVAGLVTSDRGRTVIFNPRYELLPQPTDVQP
ncbi:ATP-dependent DNA helicase RecG [Flavimobilis soli]|uniref:ATP-dependent DNA helicase RecG n=1 Tax=Flavimobilis soli TaxID=442709 RepID=A0A2A9EB89_9MICO|nr:OB-fold nucleic acid binding domain-containing protein [Flavimobilis soli]PFG35512.1 ATP-dependent DNA helicase RecG [Flavimobilis soli]